MNGGSRGWIRGSRWRFGAAALLVAAFLPFATYAQDSSAISQGFLSQSNTLAAGALVGLKEGSKDTVELSTTERAERLTGVVGTDPLIELSTGNTQVQVVTNGTTQALLSDINGEVKAGDRITASPVEGVGMKATGSAQIIGVAQADLASVQTQGKTVKDRDGKNQAIKIGAVPLQINITYYTAPQEQTSFLPSFLQQMANAVAGKEVAAIRVVIALLLLLMGFISIGVLLSSSVRSSLISIGRNPLSEGAVHKGLLEVGALATGILLVMLIAIYLILTV